MTALTNRSRVQDQSGNAVQLFEDNMIVTGAHNSRLEFLIILSRKPSLHSIFCLLAIGWNGCGNTGGTGVGYEQHGGLVARLTTMNNVH